MPAACCVSTCGLQIALWVASPSQPMSPTFPLLQVRSLVRAPLLQLLLQDVQLVQGPQDGHRSSYKRKQQCEFATHHLCSSAIVHVKWMASRLFGAMRVRKHSEKNESAIAQTTFFTALPQLSNWLETPLHPISPISPFVHVLVLR